jgi:hypothetical protein
MMLVLSHTATAGEAPWMVRPHHCLSKVYHTPVLGRNIAWKRNKRRSKILANIFKQRLDKTPVKTLTQE